MSVESDDFLGQLMEMRNLKSSNPDHDSVSAINDDIITAQASIFFAAGNETAANALSTVCYNLAQNQDVQVCFCTPIHDTYILHIQ